MNQYDDYIQCIFLMKTQESPVKYQHVECKMNSCREENHPGQELSVAKSWWNTVDSVQSLSLEELHSIQYM